jgi:ankyrin repeat protein
MGATLFDAIESRDVAAISRALDEGADPNAVRAEPPPWRPLHAAIEEMEDGGPAGALVVLVRRGARVDAWDGAHDSTPLLMACFREQREAARILLAAGADPNVVGSEGDTPLGVCVERGDVEMATLLLACDAKTTIDRHSGLSGATPLGHAVSRLDVPMVELLLDHGADPDALDVGRRSARERLPDRGTERSDQRDAVAALLDRSPE